MQQQTIYDFMILKMWYWNWAEDDSINKVVLLKNDNTLDTCVREVVENFALRHNHSRPECVVNDKNALTAMMLCDIFDLELSKQQPCQYSHHTMMNVLSYTNTRGDGHIEVMGLYTNTYQLLGI